MTTPGFAQDSVLPTLRSKPVAESTHRPENQVLLKIGVIAMKNILVKTMLATATAGLLVASLGASAAETHKCKKGEKWDATAKACVVVKK